MELNIVSWDDHDLDDENFGSYFPAGSVMLQADGKPIIVERQHYAPLYIAKNRSARLLPIHIIMKGTISEQIDTLKAWFNTFDDSGLKTLIVRDDSQWSRYWYVEATPISMPKINGQEVIINLLVPDGIWKSNDTPSEIWNVTASGQTHDVSISGNSSVDPVITISPQDEKSTGAAYRCFVTLYPRADFYIQGEDSTSIVAPMPVDIGNNAWDTDALVTAGKMQADGSDIQVLIDGIQSNYWLDDINTNNTSLWINVPRRFTYIGATLGTAIAATGDVDTITFENSSDNLDAIEDMPNRGIVLIGSEIFTYNGKSVTGLTLYDVQRARYETSMGAHSVTDTIVWLKYEIWVYYGNHGLPSFTVDDDYKPMFELASSTNTSRDYNDFWETDENSLLKPRAASFCPGNIGSEISAYSLGVNFYYETMTASNPNTQTTAVSTTASVLGQFALNGNAGAYGAYIHGYGTDSLTHITISGTKWYEAGASWFDTYVWREYYTGGSADLLSEAAPAVAGVAEAWNQNNVALTNNNTYIYTVCTRSATTNESRIEASDVTFTLDSNTVPVFSIGTETECYHVNSTLTNNTTGEYITVSYRLPVGDSLEIDTEDKTVTWSDESTNARSALGFSAIRYDWLQLQSGANELQYDETGAADVDITISWKDRSA